MDSLLTENSNFLSGLKFDHGSISICPNKNLINEFKKKSGSVDGFLDPIKDLSPPSSTTSDVESPEDTDSSTSNSILKFISEMLMEEDLEQKTCMLQDCLALQATEKSFYDVLDQKYSPDLEECSSIKIQSTLTLSTENPDHVFSPQCSSSDSINGCCCDSNSSAVLDSVTKPVLDSLFVSDACTEIFDVEDNSRSGSIAANRGKKNHQREEDDGGGERSTKQTAFTREEAEDDDEDVKLFDEVLLCPGLIHNVKCPLFDDNFNEEPNAKPLFGRGRTIDAKKKKKKNGRKGEVVDLWTLLTQCAQAVASNDHRSSTELLKQIRQHSSAFGDGNQRLAHYFANGLEARLDGTVTRSYLGQLGFMSSAADILKAYQMWVQASPFKRMSNFFANRTIMKMAEKAEKTSRLHIIDFGILYGFQWPCLIQRIAKRPGGPPKLKITGIELPQPGFRPAERVEETGRRLLKYCKRFGVEAEYHSVAKKWETIELDDLKIDPEEMTVVNCLYRLRNLPDESVVMDSPRDTVLNLIRRINPDLFVFGSVNGTYNAPFFLTRFREALFHFSSLFDMFDATVEREDEHRMLFEREVYGRDAMNVIACEGLARVERPETYKQWQVRTVRAGFRQIPLDQDIFKRVKHTVRMEYHKDFIIDLDGQWMLQGWKGRVIHALSCWVPA